jgi:GNAT superfamily N-acetyltransferase
MPCVAGDLWVRRATAADLPPIQDVVAAAYTTYLGRMDRPPAPMLRDYAEAVGDGTVWVTGNPVTGLITLIPAGDSLLIENVAVHPAAQGTGFGRRLLDFAEQEARRLGLRRLTLYTNEVMTENHAIYAHLGYRELARRTDDGYRRIFMEKVLRPGRTGHTPMLERCRPACASGTAGAGARAVPGLPRHICAGRPG